MKLILKTSDKTNIELREHIMRFILMDALYEFIEHRGPSAEEYVNKRYPNTPDYAWLNRPGKIREVEIRKRIAEELRNAQFEIVVEEEE